MVHTCVVAGCRNRRTPGTSLSFYRFPRDPERKQRWIAAVNREGWVPNDGSRLCSTHFISKQVKNPRSPDYVPSVFTVASLAPEMKEPGALEILDKQEARVEAANALLFLQGQGRSAVEHQGQDEQPEEKEQETAVEESASSSLSTDEDDDDDDDQSVSDSKKGKFAHTSDVPVNFDDILKALKRENQALRESVEKMSLSENSLRNDAEKVKFYTGLPNYFVLETVMWLLAPHMDGMKNVKLSKFQQLLLTLMRLRLDLRNQDLAYRFGVKVATVTRTVHRMVNIMSSTLVPTAVFWPSRAELRKNLPAALRASHPDCAVIIDCFTVPFEEPVSTAAGPSYNVFKYLIGVAPQGVVTFVSRGVLGNVSDKSLAEGCGFLCKLLPGDVVLASRDLDIGESVAARGALFKIAGSYQGETETYGRSEGSLLADPSSETVSVQRHVERVISMVKQRYAMLTGPVESPFTTASERTSNLSTFDKIVQVACALNNLCISAAPLE
uniref:THAP-type domain-containing protein n=1 Tax=Amphilophus citrinellus TaxID=61819 RepID=A0A3Q0REQ0_AMPCI